MDDEKHEDKQDNNQLDGFLAGFLFLGGLLLGSVAGAGAMLLMAPQSGKKTRKQIRQKSRRVLKEVRDKSRQVSTSIQKQSDDLHQRGQDMVDQQKERWEPVIEAGKTAVQS